MDRLKIATLHCFGSNPLKHATQRYHFKHCIDACANLAEWTYPAAPHRLAAQDVRDLLEAGMGCPPEEVEAFGFEDPRCWYRFTEGRYLGLEESLAMLADFCRRERPDGIAGYSNGAGAALLAAAAREAGEEAFRSIRFVMSFAGPTSPTMQDYIRRIVGEPNGRISIPTLVWGTRRDPMLAAVDPFAQHCFTQCDLALVDEARPYANHALPEAREAYAPVVQFLHRQMQDQEAA